MSETVLQVEGLIKDYGSLRAVNLLSFKVEKGSVFGILGPNGSGKSTTLGILTGVIHSTAGSFSWFGQPGGAGMRKRLGTLLERPNFYGYMNAVDNLKIVAEIRDIDYSLIPDVLKTVKLYERRKSRFKTYSFGMQQRLAIASALLGDPDVLILDEPTNGLDPEGIAEIRQMIIDIARGGKTIILASHLLDEVQKVCTDVLIMKKGEKIYSGDISGIGTESAMLEMAAANMAQLREVALTHPRIKSAHMENGMLIATMDSDFDAAEINSYLMEYGVKLSHLTTHKQTLEDQFLELLKNGKS
jgi:ABC-2 type transport system ATP-binding protein